MLRALGTLLLALTVGVILTAAPCVDCVAKVQQASHHCCGKPKPEPGHKCASEAKTTSAEAKVVSAETLAPGEVLVDLPALTGVFIELEPLVLAQSPPDSPPLSAFRC
jgi:hypothetical protein